MRVVGCWGSNWRRWWRDRKGSLLQGSIAIGKGFSERVWGFMGVFDSFSYPAFISYSLRSLATDADTDDMG